jgi:hypothetical protein
MRDLVPNKTLSILFKKVLKAQPEAGSIETSRNM